MLLDEGMVWILRKRQRAQVERVDGGQVEQLQIRRVAGEEFEVVLDDVVTDQTKRSFGEPIECCKRGAQPAAASAPSEGGRAVGSYRADRADSLAALKVDRQQAGKTMRRQTLPYTFLTPPALDCHR